MRRSPTRCWRPTLDAGRTYGMDELSEKLLGQKPTLRRGRRAKGKSFIGFARVAVDKATEYSAEDPTSRCACGALQPRTAAESMSGVYETLERDGRDAGADGKGAAFRSTGHCRACPANSRRTWARLESEIYELAGEVQHRLAQADRRHIVRQDGLPARRRPRPAHGRRRPACSTIWRGRHELPRRILDWRQLSKLKSTYTDALPGFNQPQTKRILSSYAPRRDHRDGFRRTSRTFRTFRCATRPAQDRTAFVATPGQADLGRLFADRIAPAGRRRRYPALKKAFADGLDIHAMTASEMFGVPVEGMPGEIRRRAKAINFGIVYGISAVGSPTSSASRATRRPTSRIFRALPPASATYMDATKKLCRERGYGDDAVRPQVPLPAHNIVQIRRNAPSTSARRSTRRSRARRRHHPPRHGADGRALRRRETLGADAVAGPSTTNWCSRCAIRSRPDDRSRQHVMVEAELAVREPVSTLFVDARAALRTGTRRAQANTGSLSARRRRTFGKRRVAVIRSSAAPGWMTTIMHQQAWRDLAGNE